MKPDYGLDAPGVVRNLLVIGIAGLVLWGGVVGGIWSGVIPIGPVRFDLGPMGLWAGAALTMTGFWMIWSSKVGKLQEREKTLDAIPWSGAERVLDIGCGRGLMLIGAAKRLTTGKATGIDLWQESDLSGNRAEATLENARREGVAERIAIETADMRQLPFPDNSFDVVVSRAAIHNLYQPAERAQAITEIARVLRPGGSALIDDIRHSDQYISVFQLNNCTMLRRLDSQIGSMFATLLTMGSLRPAILLVRKEG